MREPEFLPRWYPQLLNRRRVLVAQAWATSTICALLAVWAIIGMRRTEASRANLAAVQAELAKTGVDLQHLADLSAIQRELERQDEIVRGLGVDVPVSRMLAALDQLMPRRMALEDLHLQTEEVASAPADPNRAKGTTHKMSRKLRMTLTGVAPSQDELAIFLTDLVAVPYFGEVELVKAEESPEDYHLVRRFEVKFAMSLDGDQPRPAAMASTSADGGNQP